MPNGTAVDKHGMRLTPFATNVRTFQDYESFVPWGIVSLASVITFEQLPQMREVLDELIRRGFQEAPRIRGGAALAPGVQRSWRTRSFALGLPQSTSQCGRGDEDDGRESNAHRAAQRDT